MTAFYLIWIPAVILTLLASWWTLASYRQHKLNIHVAHELDSMIGSTIKSIQKTKDVSSILDGADPLSAPGMLATIVTVLVNKFGDTRLSMKDFMLSDEEYVSVYVDTDTEEIILSLNTQLGKAPDFSMIKFGNNDDNTFH
tara:strand:+ start:939 stop:1361 length:423 start_codon:yes stop_codon:yes gene_type:complete